MVVLCPNQLTEQKSISIAKPLITCTWIVVTSKFALVYCDPDYLVARTIVAQQGVAGNYWRSVCLMCFVVLIHGGPPDYAGFDINVL